MSNFLTRNKADWQELEVLLADCRKRFRRLTPEDLSRLDVLYRRTAVHLAQVSSRTTDAKLVRYLNDLTASAHSIIYLPPKQSLFAGAIRFVVDGFSRVVARTWRFHAVSAALLFGGAILAYCVALHDPIAAYALSFPCDQRLPGSTPEQLQESLRQGREQGGAEKFLFSTFLFAHNLKVGLLSMGAGMLAAVPTVLLMFYNGMLVGAFAAMHHKAGIHGEFWAWILPHGIPELSAIVLCGGVGLMLGNAVVCPRLLTRGESIKRAGVEAARICVGVAGMLLVAAIIESYVRQSYLSTQARLVFAAVSAVAWFAYFANGFWQERAAKAGSSAEAARTG